MKKLIIALVLCLTLGCCGLTFVGCGDNILDNGQIIVPGNDNNNIQNPDSTETEPIVSVFDRAEKTKWSEILIELAKETPYLDNSCIFEINDLENGFTIDTTAVCDMYLDDIGMFNNYMYSNLDEDFVYNLYINVEYGKIQLVILL